MGKEGREGCWWLGDRVECTHGQGVYLFEYVDSWGVKDPLCMTRATKVGEVKESKNKEIEFHVLNILERRLYICHLSLLLCATIMVVYNLEMSS